MWRNPGFSLLKQALNSAVRPARPGPGFSSGASFRNYCSSVVGGGGGGGDENVVSYAEAKRLMRLVNVEALKEKLGMENKEVIPYADLLKACEGIGVAKSAAEAAAFARVLDEAGVVLLFRDQVYLHPHKVRIYLSSWILGFSTVCAISFLVL